MLPVELGLDISYEEAAGPVWFLGDLFSLRTS